VSPICEDIGPGVSDEMRCRLFELPEKGRGSNGHRLGLASNDAVAHAHRGNVTACDRDGGRACTAIIIPFSAKAHLGSQTDLILGGG
jgi:nitrogen-specific signal transduction histidine kinase